MADIELVRKLAACLALRPQSTLGQLAKSAGIGRTTLHRIAATRTDVIAMLKAHGKQTMELAVKEMEAHSDDPEHALRLLSNALLTERDLFAFLFHQYAQEGRALDDNYFLPPEWLEVDERLDRFFLAAQKRGQIRLELPAAWMTDHFWASISAVHSSIARGRIAPATANQVMFDALWHGISNR